MMPNWKLHSIWDGLRGAAGRRLLVISLLSIHFVLAVSSTLHKCTTYDEIVHITAGYAYWRFNDYRLHPENGNLPQRIAALPLVLTGGYRFPDLDQVAWETSHFREIGRQFFYTCGNDLQRLLLSARSAIAVLSVLLCLVVYLWSKKIFGTAGGLVSLCLCVFSPTILAHGRLATSDLCHALFATLSLWAVWSLLHRVSLVRVFLSGLAVAGLFLSKTSAVLFLPVAAILALIALAGRRPLVVKLPGVSLTTLTSSWRRAVIVCLVAGLLAAESLVVIWGAYGFRYSAFRNENGRESFFAFGTVEKAAEKAKGAVKGLALVDRYRLLPQAYSYGVLFVAAHLERTAFLNGEYSKKGFPQYFPYCLMVKTPLPTLILVLLGIVILLRRSRPAVEESGERGADDSGKEGDAKQSVLYQVRPLFLWLVVLWPVFVCSTLNIGHRHILATYPAMFILAGATGMCCRESKRLQLVVGGLLVWLIWETLGTYPHFLAYFNQFVDRGKAHEHLVDSNLDWGQDLPGLQRWLEENRSVGERVYLEYFGTGSPAFYGIQSQPLPCAFRHTQAPPLQGGLYCISATSLQMMTHPGLAKWSPAHERAYRETRTRLTGTTPPASPRLGNGDRNGGAEPPSDSRAYNLLVTARLMAFLRHREPVGHTGHSILIYRLSDEDVRTVYDGPPPGRLKT